MQCIECNADCGAEDFCSADCQISFDRAEAREQADELERRAYAEHVRPVRDAGAEGDELSAAIRKAEEACERARERVAAEQREREQRRSAQWAARDQHDRHAEAATQRDLGR